MTDPFTLVGAISGGAAALRFININFASFRMKLASTMVSVKIIISSSATTTITESNKAFQAEGSIAFIMKAGEHTFENRGGVVLPNDQRVPEARRNGEIDVVAMKLQ